MSYMDEYRFWLEDDYFDQNTKKELGLLGATRRRSRIAFIRNWSLVPAVSGGGSGPGQTGWNSTP